MSTVNGPFMFAEQPVTGNTYLDMLKQLLVPQLISGEIMDTVVFQQDVRLPHFILIVQNYPNQTFLGKWIDHASRRMWGPCSLTSLRQFCQGGYQVYGLPGQDMQHWTLNRIDSSLNF